MTHRDAKRLAYFHAGLLLDDALSAGWELEELVELGVRQIDKKPRPDDQDKLYHAFRAVIDELYNKGKLAK